MCFTVAIVRQGKKMSAKEYYAHLPIVKELDIAVPELPDYYLVSGFAHPELAIVKKMEYFCTNGD